MGGSKWLSLKSHWASESSNWVVQKPKFIQEWNKWLCLGESLNHSFNQFVQTLWFIQKQNTIDCVLQAAGDIGLKCQLLNINLLFLMWLLACDVA